MKKRGPISEGKERYKLEKLVKTSRTGSDLARMLVEEGLVDRDFDKKVKGLVVRRRRLLERLK